ncbi:MAG: response regulator transcription factor [Rikenellaceae bacterium]|jgi:DNA-binding NarL/FixJ family response regulator|nr:response regulator transcription factor [Rikenellaceae bacterium]
MEFHVILFDRQEITRLGLQALLREGVLPWQEYSLSTVSSKSELVQALTASPEALVVMDYTLSDLDSATSLLNIGIRFPLARWVLFSEELSVVFLKRVLCEGTFGVVLKSSELAEIRAAIAAAIANKGFVCRQVEELLRLSEEEKGEERGRLTATEQEILREIALGRSAKEIAALRRMSTHTVTTHRKNIYRKLEVNNSQEATRYALRAGLINTSDYNI